MQATSARGLSESTLSPPLSESPQLNTTGVGGQRGIPLAAEAGGVSGQRLYDWCSHNSWALRLLYAVAFLGRESTFRRRGVEALELEPGEAVLELGCGPGNSLGRLREAVGPEGRVVGVDYSEGMVERAAGRVEAEGWQNVGAVRGDATRLGVRAGRFDAVYASMSLTAMPDRKSTRLNSSHITRSRMPSSA